MSGDAVGPVLDEALGHMLAGRPELGVALAHAHAAGVEAALAAATRWARVGAAAQRTLKPVVPGGAWQATAGDGSNRPVDSLPEPDRFAVTFLVAVLNDDQEAAGVAWARVADTRAGRAAALTALLEVVATRLRRYEATHGPLQGMAAAGTSAPADQPDHSGTGETPCR